MSHIEFNFFLNGDDVGFDKEAKLDIVLEIGYSVITHKDRGIDYSSQWIEIKEFDVVYFGIVTKKKSLLNSFKNKKSSLSSQSEDIWDGISKDKQNKIIETLNKVLKRKDIIDNIEDAIADESVAEAERRAEYGRY